MRKPPFLKGHCSYELKNWGRGEGVKCVEARKPVKKLLLSSNGNETEEREE